jgi:hypothetical protein
MRTLSIRQPWAWLILNAGKDVENRDWATAYRGPILIHAGKGMTRDEYESGADTLAVIRPDIELPPLKDLERGGIVGMAEIGRCVTHSDSPWFFGPHGFVLLNARPLPFIPWRGQLGFFDVPYPPSPSQDGVQR